MILPRPGQVINTGLHFMYKIYHKELGLGPFDGDIQPTFVFEAKTLEEAKAKARIHARKNRYSLLFYSWRLEGDLFSSAELNK